MCAPRTCLPPQKKIGSRLRARYVRSAHMFAPKKSDPSNSKKSARASRSLCALRAHVCPPIINRCPLLAPPLFKSWCRHCLSNNRFWPSTFLYSAINRGPLPAPPPPLSYLNVNQSNCLYTCMRVKVKFSLKNSYWLCRTITNNSLHSFYGSHTHHFILVIFVIPKNISWIQNLKHTHQKMWTKDWAIQTRKIFP